MLRKLGTGLFIFTKCRVHSVQINLYNQPYMQYVASILAGEGLTGVGGRAYWVVKWRGVGVYLFGT
jgi:hypothetical protein